MKLFSYTPTELAEQLTSNSHSTLHYLESRGYLTSEQVDELVNIVMVTAIPNKPGFGKRILHRMFGNSEPLGTTWVFPIVELDERYNNHPLPATPIKPDLKIVP